MTNIDSAAPGSATDELAKKVAAALGVDWVRLNPVAGNWGLTVYRADTDVGPVAIKAGRARLPGHLQSEARMLTDLAAAGLAVPRVLATTPDLLAMAWIEHDTGPLRPVHERAAGEALARLHAVPRLGFGYAYDTHIGALTQPNAAAPTWRVFFRDQRLMHYAGILNERCLMPDGLMARIERLADRLERWLAEPTHPALVHGDVWYGNVLVRGAQIAAFIDPALYHGDPEIELAYVTMHGTFGRAFFEAYEAHRPIEPGFHQLRRDILLLPAYMMHAILCGPDYLHRVDRTLARLGL